MMTDGLSAAQGAAHSARVGVMNRHRVLIVEDDPFIAMDIEAAVSENLGDTTEIFVVDSLRDAQAMTEGSIDVALLDVDVVGGKTFEIALDLIRRGTPFAFVSGSLPADLPPELGSAAFVRKPFHARDIVGFVRSALERIAPGGRLRPSH